MILECILYRCQPLIGTILSSYQVKFTTKLINIRSAAPVIGFLSWPTDTHTHTRTHTYTVINIYYTNLQMLASNINGEGYILLELVLQVYMPVAASVTCSETVLSWRQKRGRQRGILKLLYVGVEDPRTSSCNTYMYICTATLQYEVQGILQERKGSKFEPRMTRRKKDDTQYKPQPRINQPARQAFFLARIYSLPLPSYARWQNWHFLGVSIRGLIPIKLNQNPPGGMSMRCTIWRSDRGLLTPVM